MNASRCFKMVTGYYFLFFFSWCFFAFLTFEHWWWGLGKSYGWEVEETFFLFFKLNFILSLFCFNARCFDQ